MQFFRSKEEAAKCCYLKYGRNGMYLDCPVVIGFVCLNPDVTKAFKQAKFSSLDVCCLCEYYKKIHGE